MKAPPRHGSPTPPRRATSASGPGCAPGTPRWRASTSSIRPCTSPGASTASRPARTPRRWPHPGTGRPAASAGRSPSCPATGSPARSPTPKPWPATPASTPCGTSSSARRTTSPRCGWPASPETPSTARRPTSCTPPRPAPRPGDGAAAPLLHHQQRPRPQRPHPPPGDHRAGGAPRRRRALSRTHERVRPAPVPAFKPPWPPRTARRAAGRTRRPPPGVHRACPVRQSCRSPSPGSRPRRGSWRAGGR